LQDLSVFLSKSFQRWKYSMANDKQLAMINKCEI